MASRNSNDGFCSQCGVTLDLHFDHEDGEGCESAQMKADVLNTFDRMVWKMVHGQ